MGLGPEKGSVDRLGGVKVSSAACIVVMAPDFIDFIST
jgi:hypothetical protein